MSSVLPANIRCTHQPKIGFVNQGRGLEGLARTFPLHVMPRTPQFAVNLRNEFVQRRPVSRRPGA